MRERCGQRDEKMQGRSESSVARRAVLLDEEVLRLEGAMKADEQQQQSQRVDSWQGEKRSGGGCGRVQYRQHTTSGREVVE